MSRLKASTEAREGCAPCISQTASAGKGVPNLAMIEAVNTLVELANIEGVKGRIRTLHKNTRREGQDGIITARNPWPAYLPPIFCSL